MRAPSQLYYQARATYQPRMSVGRAPLGWASTLLFTSLFTLPFTLLAPNVTCAEEGARAKIERALDPFLTNAEYRDADERVEYADGRAEVWVLESLEQGELAKKVCQGARWLIGGRLKRSTGARGAFLAIPQLRELSLIFFKVKTKVNPNLEGRYVQIRSAMTAARFTLSRERALMLHSERVLTLLQGPQCEEQARQLIDDLWISPEVVKSRELLQAIQPKSKSLAPVTTQAP